MKGVKYHNLFCMIYWIPKISTDKFSFLNEAYKKKKLIVMNLHINKINYFSFFFSSNLLTYKPLNDERNIGYSSCGWFRYSIQR